MDVTKVADGEETLKQPTNQLAEGPLVLVEMRRALWDAMSASL